MDQHKVDQDLFRQVVGIEEAVNWIAFGDLAGSAVGPVPLFHFSENDTDWEGYVHMGRTDLALDLLWAKAETGQIDLFGRKALTSGSGEDRTWTKPAKHPEHIPAEIIASASWTDDDEGGIEGEDVSFWNIAVCYDGLTRCFPARLPSGRQRAVTELMDKVVSAGSPVVKTKVHSIVSVEKNCRFWIAELAAQGVSPRSRDDLFAQALAKFPSGLGRRGFDRCWDQAAPDVWKRAGRKPRHD